LQEAYFGCIPDAFRRPNTLLYQWLKEKIEGRAIRGIVFFHYLWCDTWRVEAQRMKEWGQVPVLVLDADETETMCGRLSSRIQAFLEVLK